MLAFKGRYVGLEEDRHLLHYRVYSSFAQLTTAQCSQLLDIVEITYIFQNLQGYKPNLTKPNLTKPNLSKPNLTIPDITEPKLTKPKLTKPNLT